MPSVALRNCAPPADDGLVSISRRSFQAPAGPDPRSSVGAVTPRRGPLALALTAALSVVLMIAGAPAGAVVTTVGSSTVGAQPRNDVTVLGGNGALGDSFDNVSGNPVVHASNTYAIYWDPTDHYHGDWQHLINTFLFDVGHDSGTLGNVFAVDSQYTDRSNVPASYRSTFRGAYTDTNKYPAIGCTDPEPMLPGDAITCVTDKQIQEELKHFIAQHALTTGMSTIFYLLTPPGVTVCLDAGGGTGHCSDSEPKPSTSYSNSFCSYHSDISPTSPTTGDANTILYAMIPWTAGGAGDFHLKPADQTTATECQDGGFDPTSEEKKEKPKEKTKKQEEEFKELTAEEKQKVLEAEALEGPHQQEPNQVGRGPDGSYDTGLADLIVNQIAVEQQNTVTNPLLDAWQDSVQNEATDECRNFFATGALGGSLTADTHTGSGSLANEAINTGSYYLNDAFNLAAARLPYPAVPCLGGVNLVPAFTAPNPVNSGDVVAFDGMESNITLNAAVAFSAGGAHQPNYATYTWNFGDGTPTVSGYAPGAPSQNSPASSPCEAPWLAPCAGTVFHSYQYGGEYEVTLSVRDVGGNTVSTAKVMTVDGPPRPSEPGGPSTPGPGTQSGGSPSSSGGAASTHASPVATQAIVSHSLKTVLRGGLVVRYSVNEQIAGRFEVLLASSIARRLGLHGPRATGLAPGTPPQTVIAKAILVTTKGGRGTYKIKFSKATAARLRRLRKVSLMLRLAVHNASSPTVTTVLSTVNLSH